jgi:hypothetical protein
VSGAIQFSNGSAFASDASNFFWDDTNNRLGVGTNAPSATTHIKGSGATSATTSLLVQNSAGTQLLKVADDGTTTANILSTTGATSIFNGTFYVGSNFVTSYGQSIGFFGATVASAIVEIQSTSRGFLPPRMTTTQRDAIATPATGLRIYNTTTNTNDTYNGTVWQSNSVSGVSGSIQFSSGSAFASDASNLFWDDTNNRLGVGTNAPSATIHIKGSGTTSATTSLVVQNSAGTAILTVKDGGSDKQVVMNSAVIGSIDLSGAIVQVGTGVNMILKSANGVAVNNDYSSANASAQLDVSSTTKGFLPPRMTTTQKNAIASPAAGLMVYDTTLAKLCVYTTAWETITSV